MRVYAHPTADVPGGKIDPFVGDRLNVEAHGGHSGDHLAELQLVECSSLSCCFQTEKLSEMRSRDQTAAINELEAKE